MQPEEGGTQKDALGRSRGGFSTKTHARTNVEGLPVALALTPGQASDAASYEILMAEGGVPFTAILTISDPEAEKPVFNDMRQSLQAIGTQIADIRTAARITPRV